MDNYNVIVLMEKDKESGFLTETIDSYTIENGIELIDNIYLKSEDDKYYIYLTLTTKDVEDWEYYGIYELYDEEVFRGFVVDVLDGSGEYNPQWILKLMYSSERAEMEERLNKIMNMHINELKRIEPDLAQDKERFIKELEEDNEV